MAGAGLATGSGTAQRDRHDIDPFVCFAVPVEVDQRQRARTLLDAAVAEARAKRLRLEEALTTELTGSLGLGGRVRDFAASTERARTSVRKAVKRALDVLAEADPALGAELRGAISTGATCRYAPSGLHTRHWRLETGVSPERTGADRSANR